MPMVLTTGEFVKSSKPFNPMRRIRFIRRKKPSAVSEREMALCVQVTELQNDNTRLKKLYSEARAGLRQATGCETPSPRARKEVMDDATLHLEERRRNMTPSQAIAMRLEVEETRENLIERMLNGEVDLEMRTSHSDMTRKLGLMVFVLVSLFVSMMLFFHPIILTWLLNWEIT